MTVEKTVIAAADSFAQIQYALILEFKAKLTEYSETFDVSKLPELQNELDTLTSRLEEVNTLREKTLLLKEPNQVLRNVVRDIDEGSSDPARTSPIGLEPYTAIRQQL